MIQRTSDDKRERDCYFERWCQNIFVVLVNSVVRILCCSRKFLSAYDVRNIYWLQNILMTWHSSSFKISTLNNHNQHLAKILLCDNNNKSSIFCYSKWIHRKLVQILPYLKKIYYKHNKTLARYWSQLFCFGSGIFWKYLFSLKICWKVFYVVNGFQSLAKELCE